MQTLAVAKKMAASTSTVTTSREGNKGGKLRTGNGKVDVELEVKDEREPLNIKEHDFFWTYTEEPHRTRRMAIIKAHPEVFHLSFSYILTAHR